MSAAHPVNRTIVLLSLAAFASAASMRTMDALLVRIASVFDVGLASAANVVTAFAVVYGAMQLVMGPLGDRHGKLRVIAVACGAAALASLGCAAAPTFPALLVARAVTGATCACVIPLAMAWIGDVTTYQTRQPVLARFLLGQILGFGSGAAFGGLAAASAFWQWPFIVIAAWFAAVALVLGRSAWRQPSGANEGGGHLLAHITEVLRTPAAWPVLATVFLEGVTLFGGLAFVATHLYLARGASLPVAGAIFMAFGGGGALFALVARRLVPALGEPKLAGFGTLVIATSLLAVTWVPSLAVATLGCLGTGLGFYMLHNTLQTNATQMCPTRRGTSVAIFASLYFLGQAIGVAIAGQLVEHIGTGWTLSASALAMLPVGLAYAVVRARRAMHAG